jgi:hypothetical protein
MLVNVKPSLGGGLSPVRIGDNHKPTQRYSPASIPPLEKNTTGV